MSDFPADYEGELLHPDELEHLLRWLRTHPYVPGGEAWDEPLETGGHGDVTADALRELWTASHDGFDSDGTERAVLGQRLAALSYGRCGQTYAQAATEALIQAYVPLAKRIQRLHASTRIVEQNPNLLDTEDVQQTVLLGLLVAIDEAPADRPEVTNPVAMAARRWVAKELSTLYSAIFSTGIPQRTRERFSEIMRAAGGNPETAAAMAPSRGMTEQTFWDVYKVAHTWERGRSSSTLVGGDEAEQEIDADPYLSGGFQPWQEISNDPTADAALEAIDAGLEAGLARLNDRERRVLAGHFGLAGEPQNDSTLGDALGVHRSRVAHIRATALGKLRENLTAA